MCYKCCNYSGLCLFTVDDDQSEVPEAGPSAMAGAAHGPNMEQVNVDVHVSGEAVLAPYSIEEGDNGRG